MNDSFPRGRFVWDELLTSDPDEAQSFYREIVGWSTAPFEGSPIPYTLWMKGETPVGGVMALPEEAKKAGTPPNWLAYIATPDVDETAKEAEKLGGKVLKGPDSFSVGRWAVLQDPQGAVFAAFTPADQPGGHDGDPEPGEFSWHELATTDHEAAFGFYSRLFGWKKTDAMDMGEAGTYQMYGRTDRPLGGMYDKPADMPGPPFWLAYAKVPDVDRTVEKVKTKGGQVLNGPMEVPGGDRVAQCMDPQGAMFALHSSATSG